MAKKKNELTESDVEKEFLRKYDVSLDEGNRFSVPAVFLDTMRVYFADDQMKFVLMPALFDSSVKVYPRSVFEKKELPKLTEMDDLSEKALNAKMYILSMVDNQKTDSHGRIRLSQDLLSFAEISDENGENKSRALSVIGQLDHFIIKMRAPFEKMAKDSVTKEHAAEFYKQAAEKLKDKKNESGSADKNGGNQ